MNETEFVFVQLGTHLPKHLIQNLLLVNDSFPNIKINLVLSESCQRIKLIPDFVDLTFYTATESVEGILSKKVRDPTFREGFWRYSLERLFAIESIHFAKPNASLIHIESDILLLPEFPIDKFKLLNHVSWMCVDAEKDIASIIYFPNIAKTRKFTKDLYDYLVESDSPTDMLGLHWLRQNHPQEYMLLPTGISLHEDLHSETKDSPDITEIFSEGIFDAAGIGMWLTGFDPRNNYGVTKYFETSKLRESGFYIDPSAFPYTYEKSSGLSFTRGHIRTQIYNLHVHSKSRLLFSKNWQRELERLTELSAYGRPRSEFSLGALINLILSNFHDRTLLAFLFYSPLFKILRIPYQKSKNILNKR